jgi:uncharacterized protein YdaU (DUF1376 family)
MHLNPFQDGCYLRLVDHYMETRQPLPDNDAALARIIGISVEQWLAEASGMLRAFFSAKEGLLFHTRCDSILREQDERSVKQSEKSKKGAAARWGKNNDLDATGMPKAMPTNATRQDRTRQDMNKFNGRSHAKPKSFVEEGDRLAAKYRSQSHPDLAPLDAE